MTTIWSIFLSETTGLWFYSKRNTQKNQQPKQNSYQTSSNIHDDLMYPIYTYDVFQSSPSNPKTQHTLIIQHQERHQHHRCGRNRPRKALKLRPPIQVALELPGTGWQHGQWSGISGPWNLSTTSIHIICAVRYAGCPIISVGDLRPLVFIMATI